MKQSSQLYKRAPEHSKVLIPHFFPLLTNIVEDSDKNLECLRRGSGGVVPAGPIGCHLISAVMQREDFRDGDVMVRKV